MSGLVPKIDIRLFHGFFEFVMVAVDENRAGVSKRARSGLRPAKPLQRAL